MKIDLNTCKPGQKLKSCHGAIFEYVGRNISDMFPHIVKYPNGSLGSRTDDGQLSIHKKLPEDHDIVEILPFEE